MAVSQETLTTTVGGSKKALLLIAALLALYFAYEQVIPYFVWSEEAYGYYWQFRLPLLLHVVGGLVALLCGVFQLWSGLNRRVMRTHPKTGRVYAAHQQWMVRSYIVTFAFVLFRIATDHIPAQELWGISYADWSNAMIWPVWVVPLIGYEILLAVRRR